MYMFNTSTNSGTKHNDYYHNNHNNNSNSKCHNNVCYYHYYDAHCRAQAHRSAPPSNTTPGGRVPRALLRWVSGDVGLTAPSSPRTCKMPTDASKRPFTRAHRALISLVLNSPECFSVSGVKTALQKSVPCTPRRLTAVRRPSNKNLQAPTLCPMQAT